MVFAAVRKDVVDDFAEVMEEFKAKLISDDKPYYDDKALTLLLLLRFRAGSDFELHTSEAGLCDMLGLANRTENKQSIMFNLYKMQEDGLLTIRHGNDKKFFWVSLDYDAFMPTESFVKIYKKEFDQLLDARSRDKLLWLLYYIKKYQHQNTNISFASIDILAQESKLSRATIIQGIDKLSEQVLDVYKAVIQFADGSAKEVNYYKSLCDGKITDAEVTAIAKKYYKNIKSIKRRTNNETL